MKRLARTVLCLVIGAFISINVFGLEKSAVIARDDLGKYTLADLELFMDVNDDALKDAVFKPLTDGDPSTSPSASLLKDTIKRMAFREQFVHDGLEKGRDDARMNFAVRDAIRNFIYNARMNDLFSKSAPDRAEIKKYYDDHKENHENEERRKISVLYKVFPDESEKSKEKILRFLSELKEKPDFQENFTDYVKKHSDLPGATGGGIVDYFTKGTYGPTVEEYAFKTPEGQLSPVFSATAGAYVIKCLDVLPAGMTPLEDASPIIEKKLAEKKFHDAQDEFKDELFKWNEIKINDQIPSSPSDELVVLKVNDYEVSWSMLSGVLPRAETLAEKNPGALREYLELLAQKEALLQEVEKEIGKNPESDAARRIEAMKKARYERYFFIRETQSIKVRELDMRERYEEYKEFYHGPSPKRLAYVMIYPPQDHLLPQPQYYKILEEQKRKALAFHQKAKASPENFIGLARKFASENEDVRYVFSDWMEKFPEDWRLKNPLTEYFKDKISPIFHTNDKRMIIFQVVDVKKPRILPYEEVKDKVRRVLFGMEEKELRERLMEESLKRHEFEITL